LPEIQVSLQDKKFFKVIWEEKYDFDQLNEFCILVGSVVHGHMRNHLCRISLGFHVLTLLKSVYF